MEMLELQNLHKTFNPGTVNEKVALNGVSLKMEAGDFATIVGSNGAGKSTLFNAITGGFIADEGSIVLGGQDITFEPEHQRSKVIGHLFQDPLKGTAPNMTIEENLALAYLRAGTAPHAIFSRISRKDKELFREKLSLLDMGLEDRMKQPVGLLSGGQRQALTLLMATLVTPKLLLLDEHTAALDPATAEKVLELMTQCYGNPSSLHKKGLEAQREVAHARQAVAVSLGAQPREIIFTSGGTEANNLAVLGGAAVIMFSMIVVSGIQALGREKMDERTGLIIALSLGLGVGIGNIPSVLAQLPEWVNMIFAQNSIIMTFVIATLLNLLLPKKKKAEE